MKFIQPQVFLTSFTCPHCGVLAKQDSSMKKYNGKSVATHKTSSRHLSVGNCQHCNNCTLWVEEKLYFPNAILVDNILSGNLRKQRFEYN